MEREEKPKPKKKPSFQNLGYEIVMKLEKKVKKKLEK